MSSNSGKTAGEIAKILAENPERLDKSDDDGRTLLHWACSQGDLEVVKLLLEVAMPCPPTASLASLRAAFLTLVVHTVVRPSAHRAAPTRTSGTSLSGPPCTCECPSSSAGCRCVCLRHHCISPRSLGATSCPPPPPQLRLRRPRGDRVRATCQVRPEHFGRRQPLSTMSTNP